MIPKRTAENFICFFIVLLCLLNNSTAQETGKSSSGSLVEKLKRKYASEIEETKEPRSEEKSVLQDAENYLNGENGFEKNVEKARELYLKSAEEGSTEVQYLVATYYCNGKNGFPKDEKVAGEWFRKSAEAGYSEAQVSMFYNYAQGICGLKKNRKMAQYWFDKVLESDKKGHSITTMGFLIIGGSNILKLKKPEILKLFTTAAELGDAYSQETLASMYEPGIIGFFDTDRSRAIEWYKKAARQGRETAIENLKKNYRITEFGESGPGSMPERISCPATGFEPVRSSNGLESGMVFYDDSKSIINGSAECAYSGGNSMSVSWRYYPDPAGESAKIDCDTIGIRGTSEPDVYFDEDKRTISVYSSKVPGSVFLTLSKKEMKKGNREKWAETAKMLLPLAEERATSCERWKKKKGFSGSEDTGLSSGNKKDSAAEKPKNRGPRAIME